MSKRFDNKKLFFLLAGLSVIMILTMVVKIPKDNATFISRIFELDTLKVSKIVLFPKNDNVKPVEFSRKNGSWIVQQDEIIASARKGAVQNMVIETMNIKPQSLATKDKSKWKEFELTDSLGTRIKFFDNKGKVMADLLIGKTSYKQADNNSNGGYNGNNVVATTYIRLYNESEVYSVDGFLSFILNTKFNDWRDNSFIRTGKNDITSIRFIYPADSSFNLSKTGKEWNVANQVADSVNVTDYINSLGLSDGQHFKDNYKPVLPPLYQIVIEGNNLLSLSVKCYQQAGSGEYILNSSMNPDVYFSSGTDGLFNKLFKPRSFFLK
jgi:hypothetical protein